MFHGVSHIDLSVRSLARARALYVEVMGFVVRDQGIDWMHADAGTVLLRFRECDEPNSPVSIHVQGHSLAEGRRRLIKAGAQAITELERTEDLKMVTVLVDEDMNRIVLWRELSEDEYGFDPDLTKEMTWLPESEKLLHDLLRHVPTLFRAAARRRITRRSESLATTRVGNEEVVRGSILATAKFMRGVLRKPLQELGYDPECYREEFDA